MEPGSNNHLGISSVNSDSLRPKRQILNGLQGALRLMTLKLLACVTEGPPSAVEASSINLCRRERPLNSATVTLPLGGGLRAGCTRPPSPWGFFHLTLSAQHGGKGGAGWLLTEQS